jgi:diguanylate cyclase (GGDEF)-like protein/PAS domain S-box-containing protein
MSLSTASRSEERSRSVPRSALPRDGRELRIGYVSVDREGRVLDVNPKWYEILGYSRGEVRGRRLLDFVTPESQGAFRERFTELLGGGEALNVELSMVRRDGQSVRVLFNGTAERDHSGQIKRIHSVLNDVPEVVSPKRMLEQSEERFRELFDHMSSCVAVYEARSAGEDFVLVDFNKAAERAEAISREDVVGKSVLTVFPSVKEFGLFDVFQRVWRTGNPEHHPTAEYRDQRIQGWKENYVYKLPSGEVVAIYDDVTERRQAEERVEESEKRYRTLFDCSPISLWEEDFSAVKAYIDRLRQSGIKDVRAYFDDHPEAVALAAGLVKIVEVNETTLKLYKAESKEEFQGGVGRIFGEESYVAFKEELVAISDGKIRVDFDAPTQTLTGEKNQISLTWLVAPGHEETLSKVLVAIVDITGRKRAEEALRESELKYRQVVENATEAIFVAQGGAIVFANAMTTAVIGYSNEELIVRSFTEFVHPDDRRMVLERYRARMKGEELPVAYEFRVIQKDGAVRWAELTAVRIPWNGEPASLNFVSDISTRKMAQAALREGSRRVAELHEAAHQLETCEVEEDVYRLAANAAERILGFLTCSLYILAGDKLVVKAASPEALVRTGQEIPLEGRRGGLAAETVRTGKTRHFNSPGDAPESCLADPTLQSGISVPVGNLGVLQVRSPVRNAFTEEDTGVLELLAGYTAEALRRIRLQKELTEQATRDPLTGVYNRRYFTEVVAQEVSRSKRRGRPIGLLMIDVDRFKQTNDQLGHAVGDRVLQEVGALLRSAVRGEDFVIRYGGDEFLVVLPETSGETAIVKARILELVDRWNAANPDLLPLPLRLAIGDAHWMPQSSQSIEEALAEADRLMYVCKQSER